MQAKPESRFQRPHIPVVVEQHVEEAAFLWLLRDAAVRDPHYQLSDLAGLDERVEAHLDGIQVAGAAGSALCAQALSLAEPGEVFAAAATALKSGDGELLANAADAARGSPQNGRALVSAAGWVEPAQFHYFAPSLVNSTSNLYRFIGVGGHAVQRIDPGEALSTCLASDQVAVRARALRSVGELQRGDLLPQLRQAGADADQAISFWATWSAALLGDAGAQAALRQFALGSAYQSRALNVYLRVCGAEQARAVLRAFAGDSRMVRYAMTGAGILGDPFYVPGLIARMDVPELARVAGEAFSMITGVDMAYDDLDLDEPLDPDTGPTDDPQDEDVSMDEDEDLPWPDKQLIADWWQANEKRFVAGKRYLCGERISNAACQRVLREGFQRQRVAAALEITLAAPGTVLFEWRAPGVRQQKLLGLK